MVAGWCKVDGGWLVQGGWWTVAAGASFDPPLMSALCDPSWARIDLALLVAWLQVMELVADLNASEGAKSMLDSSFMNSFIYELFLEKWTAWAKYVWAVATAL
eukprot:3506094-Prymnesium_polylepis.1